MSHDQQIDRSMLDGKDREQLHTIAGAMGVKAPTRMRKADLIDAILAAANGGDRATTARRRRPRRRPSRDASARPRVRARPTTIAALAAEEDALGAGDGRRRRRAAVDPDRARDRCRRPATADSRDDRGTDATSTAAPTSPAARRSARRRRRRRGTPTTTVRPRGRRRRRRGDDVDPEDERAVVRRRQPPRPAPSPRPRRGRTRRGGDEPRQRRVPGRPDRRSRACSTCATRATASCARAATCPGRNDVYVSASQVRRFALRKGDYVKGATRPPASNEKYPALLRVDDDQRHDARRRARAAPRFEDLTPLFPDSKLAPRAAPTTRTRSPAASST